MAFFSFGKLEALEKLKRARIQIQSKNSFFGYLSLYLKFQEVPDRKALDGGGAGVDASGNFFYVKDWIDKLSDEEVEGLILHEEIHLCLTGDSLILTSEGLKPIKDIKIGDKVYADKGYFTEVTGVSESDYKGDIYTIKSRSGLPCSFTSNHPILAKKINYREGLGFRKSFENSGSEKGIRFISADKLNKNDSLVFPIPKDIATEKKLICRLRNSFEHKKLWLDEELAYFVGYFVGNGSLHRVKKKGKWLKHPGKSERHVSLTMHENFNTSKLKEIIKSKIFRSPYEFKVKDKRAKRIVFSCYGLAKYLRKNFYDKEGKKSIPNWLLNEKKEIVQNFINGLKDSDGHEEGNLVTITSVHKGVYSFVPILLLRLGLPFSFSTYFPKDYPNTRVVSIGYRTNRENHYSKIIRNRIYYPISKIEKKPYEGKVYNLETKAHTYCCSFFVVHNCMLHLTRRGCRGPLPWNIATDIAANLICLNNSYTLPEGGIIPKYNSIVVAGKKIDDLDKKTAEMIYDELPIKQINVYVSGGSGEGKRMKGFDKHIEGKNDAESKQKEQDWIQRVEEAAASALMKGDMPAGLQSMIKGLHRSQVHWKTLLTRFVQNHIPYDFNPQICHKKSRSYGFYLPGYIKDKVKVLFVVDLSGSMGQKEQADAFSEAIGIANAYQDRVEMVLLTHDVDVQDEYVLNNSVADKLKRLKIHGGGGTSFNPTAKHINKKYKDAKCIIWLTDGCGDRIKEKMPCPILWVLTKNGMNDYIKERQKYGDKIIWLKE